MMDNSKLGQITLDMSDIIKLLNGKTICKTWEGGGAATTATLKMHREDTSITKKGAIERIDGEWAFTLSESKP